MRTWSELIRNGVTAAVVACVAAVGVASVAGSPTSTNHGEPSAESHIVNGGIFVTAKGAFHCYEDLDAKQSICNPL
jgi:hypothetical protein